MEKNDDEEDTYIDPKDLNIIINPSTWVPSREQLIAYANQLEFDLEAFRDVALKIAYKYLTKTIPNNFVRAFTKINPKLLYIDLNAKEVHLIADLEEQAKEEYNNLTSNEITVQNIQVPHIHHKLKCIPREK